MTKPCSIRIDEVLWGKFGDVAKQLKTDRTKLIDAFIRHMVADMGIELVHADSLNRHITRSESNVLNSQLDKLRQMEEE